MSEEGKGKDNDERDDEFESQGEDQQLGNV
jgi:hypothetical protein